MPTALPSRRPTLDARRAAALLILLVRLRLLDWRMERVTRRLAVRPSERDDARLLAGARTWLRLTERGAAVAGVAEPPEAAEMRAVFGEPGDR